MPIIGWVPYLEIVSENSSAPHKFNESLNPTALILFFLHKFDRLDIFKAPSQIEYCE